MSAAGANITGYALTKYLGNYSALSLTPPTGEGQTLNSDAVSATISRLLSESITKFFTIGQPLLSFVFGAVMGALIMYYGAFWCVFVPLFLILFIAIEIVIQDF